MLSGIHGLTPNMPIRSGKTFKRRITSSSACYVSNSDCWARAEIQRNTFPRDRDFSCPVATESGCQWPR